MPQQEDLVLLFFYLIILFYYYYVRQRCHWCQKMKTILSELVKQDYKNSLITKTEKKSGLMYSDAIPLITSWQNSQIKRNLLYSGLQLILWALWASVRFKIVIIFPILVGNAVSETARTHFTCKTAAWILFSLSFFLHYIIHRHTLQAC